MVDEIEVGKRVNIVWGYTQQAVKDGKHKMMDGVKRNDTQLIFAQTISKICRYLFCHGSLS